MVDTVTSKTIKDIVNQSHFVFTNVSDGSGESNVTKVDASSLSGALGSDSERLAIKKLTYCVNNGSVVISFNATANQTAFVLSGTGDLRFQDQLSPTTAAGLNGDILFTTVGFAANSTYSIYMEVDKTSGYSKTST